VTTMQRSGATDGERSVITEVTEGAHSVLTADDRDEVRSSFLRLAERFRETEARGLDVVYVIEIEGRHPTTVHVQQGRCLISPGASERAAATLSSDAPTWLDLVDGRVDGVAAFLAGRLSIRGDLNLAARFETLFHPGPEATRVLRTLETRVKGMRLESLVAGTGPPVVLLHGLGANKVSFLPTLDGLSASFEVHALDLPGFGKSSKPLPAGRRYTMAWLADVVNGYLLVNRLEGAHVVGNSMGGRVAVDLALRHPTSVGSIVGLGSAVAFDEYHRLGPLLRLGQPEWLGLAPVPFPRSLIEGVVRDLFHDPSVLPAANHRAAADDVILALRDPAHRMALFACARQLAVERSRGRRAYWRRLEHLRVPSYWIFGERDRMVSSRYAQRVAEALPSATVDLWHAVGHVPQFEVPERTNAALTDWIERIEALA
jgi:pimeloyl-ACP methyl ester carboxylesterase